MPLDEVSLAAILRPCESTSLVEQLLRRGSYRHAPGQWVILESAPLADDLLALLKLPEDWIGWQWRIRAVDAVARDHARRAVERARARRGASM